MRIHCAFRASILLALFILGAAPVTFAQLTADELLILVNKNEPAGKRLADFYCDQRKVPQDRIVELDIPTTDEMPFTDYELKVVPVVRDFIRQNKLRDKVRCLVTCYGIPIRIAERTFTPAEREEIVALRKESADTMTRIREQTDLLEKLTRENLPKFVPASSDDDREALLRRFDYAARQLSRLVMQEKSQTSPLRSRMTQQMTEVLGRKYLMEETLKLSVTPPEVRESYRKELANLEAESVELQEKRYDAAARKQFRELVKKNHGLFTYHTVLAAHLDYLSNEESYSAFDSEISLLWWNNYSRKQWLPNYLNVFARTPPPTTILMVSRLDGTDEDRVHALIETSVKVENEGLKGKIVLDAGGAKKLDPRKNNKGYWAFEDALMNLSRIIPEKTKLEMKLDENPEIIPMASVKDIALYCGWYSLRNYLPPGKLNPGTVAYHVASFEMISLHNPGEPGWAAGLLRDGAAVTIGPVREPYLHSFPFPDQLFPLLLTGKLTMAEVYWKTTTTLSWQQCLIADPLYTPYKTNPMIDPETLPEELKPALSMRKALPITTKP